MSIDLSFVKKGFEQKSTQELLDLLSYSQDDYKPEAIEVLKQVLKERAVPDEEISKSEKIFKDVIDHTVVTGTQKRIPKINKFVLWLFYIAALVMLRYIVKLATIGYVHYFEEPKDKWATIKRTVRTEADSLLKGDDLKNKWCNCVVGKFQRDYPNGEMDIPKDSLKSKSFRYAAECASNLDIKINGWNHNVVSSFKGALLQTPVVLKLPEAYKEPFCDCFINELEMKYPDGITDSIPQKVGDTLRELCIKRIIK